MDQGAQSNRPIILLAIGFLVLIGTVLSALWLSVAQEQAAGWVRHTLEVQNRLNMVGRYITQGETGQRGYIITGQDIYLAPYNMAIKALPPALDDLDHSLRDNPLQRDSMAKLRALIGTRMTLLRNSVARVQKGEVAFTIQRVRSGDGLKLMNEIGRTLGTMFVEEERLLAERSRISAQRTMLARIVLMLSTLMVIILAYMAVRDARRRLAALTETVGDLNAEIRARSAAQGQVQQLQKMEAVGQLTGGIAHDFNNMLAIITGGIELVKRRMRGEDPSAILPILEQVQAGADRAAGLTAQLLAFARRQPLEPRVLEPNKLVGGISELLRRTLGEQVQIETVLAGGLWRAHADPEQLESAIVNLAVNARDAMPGGGKLTIETANSELDERYAAQHAEVSAGQYVMISVTDTGSGMDPATIAQAFEPFFTTKEVGRGTGLGLSQVFGFVKQSSGHVTIYSEPGDGTTVKIYLPRFTGAGAVTGQTVRTADMPLGKTEELILVVEDEPRVRRMSVDALAELGYSVIEAANGHEALDMLAGNPAVCLLFTDIVMPGMSGRQLADQAQIARPDIRILYTTGYTRNAIVHNGVVDYGVAFIQKPFTLSALARKVREVLDAG